MKNKKTEAKPLPCPFCGGEATVAEHHVYHEWLLRHECPFVGSIRMGYGQSKTAIIKSWNKRADFESGRRAGLEEALAAYYDCGEDMDPDNAIRALLEEPKP